MEPYTITYSACFETQSTTTFDLQAGEDQTIIFVPLNAQDFVAELNTDFRATMILLDGNTYTGNVDDAVVIVGTDDAAITQTGNGNPRCKDAKRFSFHKFYAKEKPFFKQLQNV